VGVMKKSKFFAMILGCAAMGMIPAIASADVYSASFEDITLAPNDSGTNYRTYNAGAVLDGWTVLGNGVDVIHDQYSPLPFPNGNFAVDLNALNTGGLEQKFTNLTAGASYTLDFALSGNGVNGTVSPDSSPLDLKVIVNGVTTNVHEAFNSASWTAYSVPVVAGTDGHADISFLSQTLNSSGGPTIDAINLVPLPSAVLGGGILLGLCAMWKFRQSQQIA
jgi:hypothetical protein